MGRRWVRFWRVLAIACCLVSSVPSGTARADWDDCGPVRWVRCRIFRKKSHHHRSSSECGHDHHGMGSAQVESHGHSGHGTYSSEPVLLDAQDGAVIVSPEQVGQPPVVWEDGRTKQLEEQIRQTNDALGEIRQQNAEMRQQLEQMLAAPVAERWVPARTGDEVGQAEAARTASESRASEQRTNGSDPFGEGDRAQASQPADDGCDELRKQIADAERRARALDDRNRGLGDELTQLRQRNAALSQQLADQARPEARSGQLPPQTVDRLQELARRYPNSFQYDRLSGAMRFNADVLFDVGRDELRGEAQRLLSEFADIFTATDVSDLNILIEGHADSQRIGRPETLARHPTNWHLSVHRAESVQRYLQQAGLGGERMQITGYGEGRPRASNATREGRQLNRRVEIYVRSPQPPARTSYHALPPGEGRRGVGGVDGSVAGGSAMRVPSAVYAWRAVEGFKR